MKPGSIVTIIPPTHEGLVTGIGTRVLNQDGVDIPGVTDVTVNFEVDSFVTAYVSVAVNVVDPITAEMVLNLDTVREWAAYYGFKLERDDEIEKKEEYILKYTPLATGVTEKYLKPNVQALPNPPDQL